jgi:hypothetical protein
MSVFQMVHTRTSKDLILNIPKGSIGRGRSQVPCGGAPPPPPRMPVSLEQLLATPNDLMRRVVKNDERHGVERQQPRHQERDSYSEFLATHLPVFADATDPVKVDSWLRTTESKFGLHHCTEYQKALYAAQQLRGSAGAWWASYITALPTDHHVSWGELCTAFLAYVCCVVRFIP